LLQGCVHRQDDRVHAMSPQVHVIRAGLPDTNSAVTAQEHFEALYREHGGAVFAYARRRTSPGDAEDVVAEVFLTAWRRLEVVPSDTRVWLLGVARRVLANKRRSQSRQAALQTRLANESRHTAQPTAADASGERIRQALLSLGETDREALLLLGWEGLSHRDAARVLGVRAGTFAVRLHRARRNLAGALDATRNSPRSSEASKTMEAQ
jgi:RNA polymerase sigma-70 factor (ECF subfamily)